MTLELALKAVEEAASKHFKFMARRAVLYCARTLEEFSADHVWSLLEEYGAHTKEPRALGAVFRRLSREGRIIKTGRYHPSARPLAHSHPCAIWRSS